jgi:hypothetical protein
MIADRLTAEWDDYLSVLREDAHQLLAWGYADARARLRSARDEYDITGFIAEAMEKRTNNPQTPERFSLYSVRPEHPFSPGGQRGKDRPKLDIQIERCGRPKRYFTFEAKRLRDDGRASVSDSVAHYLGGEGVGRFVSGYYAADSLESAMLGCVQAHNGGFWLGVVGQALVDDRVSGRNSFRLAEDYCRVQVIADLPDEAVSVHQRGGLPLLRLFHVFLDCR